MQYRKKPVVIDATQWFKMGDHPAVIQRDPENPNDPTSFNLPDGHGWVPTLEGGHIVTPGDWIITGVKGEHYPCKPDIFAATYEDAAAPAAPAPPSEPSHQKIVQATARMMYRNFRIGMGYSGEFTEQEWQAARNGWTHEVEALFAERAPVSVPTIDLAEWLKKAKSLGGRLISAGAQPPSPASDESFANASDALYTHFDALAAALSSQAAPLQGAEDHGQKAYRLSKELTDHLSTQPAPEVAQRPVEGWQPIETAPKGRKVLAGYFNKLGNWRTVMACYYLPQTLQMEDDRYDFDDDGYAPEGWYEECESQESILPTDEPPTHWMPLPAAPSQRQQAQPSTGETK